MNHKFLWKMIFGKFVAYGAKQNWFITSKLLEKFVMPLTMTLLLCPKNPYMIMEEVAWKIYLINLWGRNKKQNFTEKQRVIYARDDEP